MSSSECQRKFRITKSEWNFILALHLNDQSPDTRRKPKANWKYETMQWGYEGKEKSDR
jgi:hypothetical protein